MDIKPPDFKAFYHSLDPAQRQSFAKAAGTTTGYIEVHLVRAARIPRKDKMDALWRACQEFGAGFTRSDLIQFFFSPPAKADPATQQEAAHA